MTKHPTPHYNKKLWAVIAFIVSIISVSAFFMEIRISQEREHPNPWVEGDEQLRDSDREQLVTAPLYAAIDQTPWHTNSNWVNSLENLPALPPPSSPPRALTPEELSEIIRQRSSRRAFNGAPPTIPHAIISMRTGSCMSCHAPDSKLSVAGRATPIMSHGFLNNCTQCHVPSQTEPFLTGPKIDGLSVATSFQGQTRSGPGTRAYLGAPPTIPHQIHMRNNCAACHDPGRPFAVSVSHPERGNCLQCHAPASGYDNREQFLSTRELNR